MADHDRRDQPPHVRNVSSETRHPPLPAEATELSVMDWLLGVGHVVVRRLRGAPRSPMIALHPKR
jgi:hypothetical protein